MWVDDDGVMHTVWVPPEAVLGEAAVAALRAVPDDLAGAALAALDRRYESIVDAAVPLAPRGPADFTAQDLDTMPYPTVFPGLAPRPGEALETTVLRYLDGIPPVWRVEALEAVSEVLHRSSD